MNELFRLNDVERDSKTWQKVSRYASERIERFRKRTEDPSVDERERLIAAVRISEMKELLKLASPASQPEPEAGE